MRTACALCVALLANAIFAAEEPVAKPAQTAEARKRAYASVQRELEASRPAQGATQEEILVFIELAIEGYGKFAKENPKTAEGFEAASTLAELLTQTRHPDALKYSELAVETAPAAGVEVRRVALCWALVASGKLERGDSDGARAAVEKIKDYDKGMHEQLSAQLEAALKQIEDMKQAAREADEQLQPGKEPYPIEDSDFNGEKFSLAELKGKVVLIDFWAPWHGPCMKEMPNLVELYKKNKDRGFAVVGISLDKNADQLKETIEKAGIAWPVLSDNAGWQNAIARKWNVRSIPKSYLLDRKGIIRHMDLRGEELAAAVAKLLDEKAK